MFLRLRKAARKNGLQVNVNRAVRDPRADQDARPARSRRRPAARPRRSTACRRRAVEASRRAHPGRRAAGHLARSALRRKQIGWRPPVPGWRGYRDAPASAAHWRPARCPACCPAVDRVSDASAREQTAAGMECRRSAAAPGRDTAGILAAARDGELGALLDRRRRARRPTRPGRGAGRDRRCAVRGEPRAARKRGHRARRRRVPRRAGGREGWLVHQLGGPNSAVRAVAADQCHTRSAGAGLPGRRARASTWTCRTRWRRATRWRASVCGPGSGRRPTGGTVAAGGTTGQRARRCWRAGACCSTRVGYRTASPISPAPPGRRSRGCRRPPRAEIGAAEGELVTVSTDRGEITLPLTITDMPDRRGVAAAELAGFRGAPQLGVTVGRRRPIGRASHERPD